jgi:16S rRNA (cytosine967-C5)-methyltransferase
MLSADTEIQNIFHFADEVTNEIDFQSFNRSFLIQPDLYLRIRPGKKEKVIQQLQKADIRFAELNDDGIQLSNQSKVDQLLNIDEDVVIQDYNSQKTIDLFKNYRPPTTNYQLSIWDCCAASGGKSILFHDHFPNARLTVSDVRESILVNLQKRFKRAGISNYDSFIADISSPDFSIQKRFDLVICDAPCSGSGTWSRTPEQLIFFKEEKIEHYSGLQKKIVANASKALKKDGCFLYITCSVFAKENEEVVDFIQGNLPFQLISMEYLKGYDSKADTLFAALFAAL